MTPDERQARDHQAEQRRIAQKRRDMARRLTAPPGPAKTVQDAFQPLLDAKNDRRG